MANNGETGAPEKDQRQDPSRPAIPDQLPVLPVAEVNLFPGLILPLMVVDPRFVAVVQEAMGRDRIVGLFAVREEAKNKQELSGEDVFPVGAAGYVLKMSRGEGGVLQVLLQGLSRVRLTGVISEKPHLTVQVSPLEDEIKQDQETEALVSNVRGLFSRILELSPALPKELGAMNQNIDQPGLLADMIVSSLNIKPEDKLELMATLKVKERLKKVSTFLQKELDILELGSKIHSQIKGKMDKTQREYYLREQLKAIREELGEADDDPAVELTELERALAEKNLPEEAAKTAGQELGRLKRMNPASAEYTVARTYLDWFLDLPWSEETEDNLDVDQAQKILDADHYGLEKVKKRIVEYLAVRKLKPDMKGPILCLAGPPGTGKTSLGRSIARAVGRKFVRISLGGVRDEAEIRGHRRTYVGALPGRIIQGLKKAGSKNPIFMLDEIDKLGADFRGDPSSALLEVLDPEQNATFSDHYLEVEFDLSRVMFITTANVLDTIPRPLLDRMEVISLSGYTQREKLAIAKRYLVPRQREGHGLTAKNIHFTDGALTRVISHYTREAGLRNLEREIANVCRWAATKVARGSAEKVSVRVGDLTEILGPPRYESESRARLAVPGVATGLAVTQVGGDILFIEAAAMPGSKGLVLTGQLGDVMKESAQTALSVVRSRSAQLGVADDYFAKHDLHVHIPAGATPKDGPSAGVSLATALTSLVTGVAVRPDVAMTGEITLRGLVMPVGGIKDKVLAARRAGIREVILPARNEHDLADIPDNVREEMTFHLAKKIDDVLRAAFDGKIPKKKKDVENK